MQVQDQKQNTQQAPAHVQDMKKSLKLTEKAIEKGQSKVWNFSKPFIIGGLSGMAATCVIQPIDIVKVRIQALNEAKAMGNSTVSTKPVDVFRSVVQENGVKGLYTGLGAGLLRQISYTTVRLGVFRQLSDYQKEQNGGKNLTLAQKVGTSMTAGFIGAICGNPADLALIRFQTDSMLPQNERRNYRNVGHALSTIVKTEGFMGLYKGASPTVIRALLINTGMLASFDEIKERLNASGAFEPNSTQVRCIASGAAGVIAATMSLPCDNIKTKLQKQVVGADGKMPYSGFFNCLKQSVAREGITGLWAGLPTYQARIAPHVIITLLVQEQLNSIAKNNGY